MRICKWGISSQLCCLKSDPHVFIKGMRWRTTRNTFKRSTAFQLNEEQRHRVRTAPEFSVEFRQTVSPLQCGEQQACALFSLLLWCTKPPSLPTKLLAPALVKAPGLLMQIKWWRGRGRGGEFARAQLLSTRTHSVQLLLLDQLRSVYKVPSIKEDKPTGYCTGCSPEQDVSQRLSPRVTWQETTGRTASVEEIYLHSVYCS